MSSQGPVTVVPPGWLGFMKLKTQGRNPDTVSSEIVPTHDLLKMYLNANSEFVNGTNINGITNGITSFVGVGNNPVPQGEWWYVHHYQASPAALALTTDRVDLAPAFIKNAQLGSGVVVVGPPTAYTPSTQAGQPVGVARDFFVPPGGVLGAWIQTAQVVASKDLNFGALITRMPA